MPAPDALAWAASLRPGLDPASARPLPPAGSSRALTRLSGDGGSVVLVENPVAAGDAVNENDSFAYLAAHLAGRGVPVPALLAYDRARGWLLVEDLGDRDLHAEVRESRAGAGPAAAKRVAALYREALDALVRLQVDGAAGFDPSRTHNPPRYDVALMREWESGYFVREVVVHRLGLPVPAGLDEELDRLARRAAEAGTALLLHRDYQSQNLKVRGGRVFVIDFQGARLGPPQYDLASLLLDPYADLPAPLREELLAHYLDRFTARTGADRGRFLGLFPAVASHRLMQALGAYAFLGLRRGKPAFLAHIPAALRLLAETLAPLAGDAPHLAALVAETRRLASGAVGADGTEGAS